MERYLVIKEVGYGTFGNVWRAVNKESGEIVAIKKMKRKYYCWEECMNLREVKALRKMNHPNIVKLKEVIREDDVLYFIFEYMDCNLYQFIKDRDEPFSESKIRNWCFQVFQALAYMHQQGYFHRDLKPENLLVSEDLIKVADFGLAREISSRPPFTEYVSTRWYRAPEVLLQSSVYGPAVDIWAMGAIMAELFNLRPLFPGTNEPDEIHKICSVIGSPCQNSWAEGLNLADTIKFKFPQYPGIHLSMLIPSASDYAISLISSLCLWDPLKRPTAAKALQHPFFKPCYYIPPSLRLRNTETSKTPPFVVMRAAPEHLSARRCVVGALTNQSPTNIPSLTACASLKTGVAWRKLDRHQYQDYVPYENSSPQPLYGQPARNNPGGHLGRVAPGAWDLNENLVHPVVSSGIAYEMAEKLANLTMNSGSQSVRHPPPALKTGSWLSNTRYLNRAYPITPAKVYPRKAVG
ncbi:cyclin-dependent kinase F-4-like isoform X2 [Phalaenopsis equestris]|uniref:cyclin-dependent kinase F-4-like isoform X2 n=1 Tax=Phalaenopsis equestris TaxID=78828 RepID=UPI0009E49665|nr:cyclin-dependent kinase F-4-like isoform X2 [Phalaenopsis equestris]XP_020587883.1 cyclin-dependent kinase F-4-like isoform X2 [Phalaenopsis equestris]XP_020587884.1 cyclin-dependent kinase F-4-like isoform X2 [Phalaenopsis equestris]XP_020587885.1 cyclin-dependent kinase F-4-like isoform X2 [Phalaenopsis equestris]XP_020587887.1 cyclin-dependent kinase F-4-like isoform X2 [Phalaenopsis equestris]